MFLGQASAQDVLLYGGAESPRECRLLCCPARGIVGAVFLNSENRLLDSVGEGEGGMI